MLKTRSGPGLARTELRWSLWAAVGFVSIVVVSSVLAPILMPGDPLRQDLAKFMLPPFSDPAHLLGTDFLGRDILTRIVYGARPPLLIGLMSVAVALLIGVPLGLISGLKDGFLDNVIGRISDIQMSIPGIVMALLILALLGKSLVLLSIVIALESWPLHYRVVRSYVQSARNNGYIEAARLSGLTNFRIVIRHFLPGVMPLLAVTATANFAIAVLAEAALSFLGMGVPPPTPDWGVMVSEGQTQLADAWWISIMPGIALSLLLLSMQVIGNHVASWQSARRN